MCKILSINYRFLPDKSIRTKLRQSFYYFRMNLELLINCLIKTQCLILLAERWSCLFPRLQLKTRWRVHYDYQADEFLIEPISVDEIVKIIDSSIDSRLQSDKKHILTIGDLVLNNETLIVTWRNKKLPLYPQQVHLLEFLMLNPKRPITRMELLNNIWNTDTYIDSRTIDRNITRIRDAFKHETKRDPIRTVRRVGYVFNDQFE